MRSELLWPEDIGSYFGMRDTALGSYDEGDGSPQLAAAWTDPDFDASQRAFYYLRVLQIPTCRWSSWDAIRLGIPHPEDATPWLQERAITSPIWYRPVAS